MIFKKRNQDESNAVHAVLQWILVHIYTLLTLVNNTCQPTCYSFRNSLGDPERNKRHPARLVRHGWHRAYTYQHAVQVPSKVHRGGSPAASGSCFSWKYLVERKGSDLGLDCRQKATGFQLNFDTNDCNQIARRFFSAPFSDLGGFFGQFELTSHKEGRGLVQEWLVDMGFPSEAWELLSRRWGADSFRWGAEDKRGRKTRLFRNRVV